VEVPRESAHRERELSSAHILRTSLESCKRARTRAKRALSKLCTCGIAFRRKSFAFLRNLHLFRCFIHRSLLSLAAHALVSTPCRCSYRISRQSLRTARISAQDIPPSLLTALVHLRCFRCLPPYECLYRLCALGLLVMFTFTDSVVSAL